MGRHFHSKMRLGWAGASETFHSSMTMPEASLNPQECHLTALSLGVFLTKRGSSVRARYSSVSHSILKSVVNGQSDASGCHAAMKRLRCACPTEPRFGMTVVTRVKKAN